MNQFLLRPSDVLFFRDGRPMDGASSGQGAAWPSPNILHHALHAALWRAQPDAVAGSEHVHRLRVGDTEDDNRRMMRFGALTSAGPFPVNKDGQWFFPGPADSVLLSRHPEHTPADPQQLALKLRPFAAPRGTSHLPNGLWPIISTRLPQKSEKPPTWLSPSAFHSYLSLGKADSGVFDRLDNKDCPGLDDIFDKEHNFGIAIDADTGAVQESKFYTASYLRLKADWQLGGLATLPRSRMQNDEDLLQQLFPSQHHIIIGGQQRLCTVDRKEVSGVLPLPRGVAITGTLVKWVLLTPAVFVATQGNAGGWLPSFVRAENGAFKVHLLHGGVGKRKLERLGPKEAARRGLHAGHPIGAKLVAALVDKPIPITGWQLPNESSPSGGAKPTLLAVPAGSIYYFEAESETDAQHLASALNWHGSGDGTSIVNRRSGILGEQGFGLGVCAPWQPFVPGTPST